MTLPHGFSVLSLVALLAGVALAREEVFALRSPDAKVVAPLHVANLNRLGGAALAGTPGRNSSFVNAFDRRLDTAYEAREPGPAQLLLGFNRPQALRSIRVTVGEGGLRWKLEAAGSLRELEEGAATVREVVPERRAAAVTTGVAWDEAKLPPEPIAALRLTLTPSAGGAARLTECNLLAEQTLEAINLRPKSQYVPLNEPTALDVIGYFSGGETRPIRAPDLEWSVTPREVARIVSGRIVAKRRGPVQVTVRFGKLASPPLPLEAVEGD